MIKRPLYINKIIPFIDKDIIKVLVGMRRSGKSVLLDQVQDYLISTGVDCKQIISYNFESYSTISLRDDLSLYENIKQRISNSKDHYYVFLDEIQEVSNWEKVVNSLRVDFNIDIYITGSNSQLLSGELATYLAGRYIQINVYPFSFMEFLSLADTLNTNLDIKSNFNKYVILGGMPFIGNLEMKEDSSIQYLRDIYRSVLLKDVIERNKIRDVDLLERIIIYIISNIGRTFSAKNISDYLKSEKRKISSETVYNYITACESACLLHKVKRQDLVGKKILQTQEKIFIVDHGLRQALYGKNTQNIEQVLENIIFMELLRRGFDVTIGKFKDKKIDFVAEKNKERVYIQVSYILASDKVIDREFGVLESIKDNYPKYVITMDEFDFSRNGIQHLNIIEFLRNDN
jgi:predicted AAA+ superfamily ATPase